MEIIEIESEPQFADIIKTNKFVIIDFYAQWCGPCKTIAPKFGELSKKYPTVQFVKVDVDEVSEVADICQVKSLPTFKFNISHHFHLQKHYIQYSLY